MNLEYDKEIDSEVLDKTEANEFEDEFIFESVVLFYFITGFGMIYVTAAWLHFAKFKVQDNF